MLLFDLWGESFKFALIYGIIILIPCAIVGLIGKKLINELGRLPSRTPVVQMSIFWKLVLIEIVTFSMLIAFFRVFSGVVGN